MRQPSAHFQPGVLLEVALFGAGVAMLIGGVAAAVGTGGELSVRIYYASAIAVVALGLLQGTAASNRSPAVTDGGRSLGSRFRQWLRDRVSG